MMAASASLTVGCGRSSIRLHSPSPRRIRQSAGSSSPKTLATPHTRRGRLMCRSSSSSSNRAPTPGPENESKTVLDAFFLGKALAESLNERIESTVGEVLSVLGRWQAEQQKQVQDFQEEVILRAKKAKEKAALEAMALNGVPSRPLTVPSEAMRTVSPGPDPKKEDPLQDPDPRKEDPLQGMIMD